jgi:hypothetical protein
MVLAGHRPETIMEVCSRALSFWTYQSHQERAYQEYCTSKALEKAQEQESYFQQSLAVHTSENTSLKTHVTALKKEVESTRAKYSEASEKLVEKTRQYQKLQGMYETLRRRSMISAAVFEEGGGLPRQLHRRGFDLAPARLPPRAQPGLQPLNPHLLPGTGVPLLGQRPPPLPPGTEFTISSTSALAAVAGRGQEVRDPTIASIINAASNE